MKISGSITVVAINNTSNNFTFTCKKFYTAKLWAEVGLNTDTLVYNEQKIFSGSSFQERNVNTNITNWEKRGIYINDTTLPIMF